MSRHRRVVLRDLDQASCKDRREILVQGLKDGMQRRKKVLSLTECAVIFPVSVSGA